MRGAAEAGHRVEIIRLSEKDIHYCTGCCSCVRKPGACVQQDDMAEIHEKILAADVLVLASPVYFRSYNAQMKTLIDRICPIYSSIHDKDVYFIISAAGGSFPVESTVQSLRVFTDCLSGIREKGVISITGVWDADKAQGTQAMDQAYAMGLNA